MDGGSEPIRDQDYLLLEIVSQESLAEMSDQILAVERKSDDGEFEYLLRRVTTGGAGELVLQANNEAYEDIVVSKKLQSQFRTFARLVKVLDPLEMQIGNSFMREKIPELFGMEFNPGNWHSGYIKIPERKAQILLVTISKQGKSEEHRFVDRWIDDQHFSWQSQNKTSPESLKGKNIILHGVEGTSIHLFVRDHKLLNGKAAPFVYHGKVRYQGHTGSEPMTVTFELDN
jgi:hypothetical protein